MENILIFTTNKKIRGRFLSEISELKGYNFFFFDSIQSLKEDLGIINPQFFLTTTTDFNLLMKIDHLKGAMSGQLKLILVSDSEIIPEHKHQFSPIFIPHDFQVGHLMEAINKTYDFSNGWMKSSGILNLLLNNIPIALFWKDKTLRYLGCNKIFAKDSGLKNANDIVGLTDYEVFSKKLAEEHISMDRQVISSGQPIINKEEKFENPDGTIEWHRKNKIPIRDINGEVVAIMGMYEKITDKKIAEEDLVKEKHYLQLLMDNIPDRIYFKDIDSRFTRVNKAIVELFDKDKPEDLLGKNDFDFHDPVHAKNAFEDEQQLMKSGKPLINHIESFERDGVMSWESTTKIPLYDDEKQLLGVVGISRDYTKQKQLEVDLVKEKDLFLNLMNNTPDSVYFKDKDSRFTRINKAQAELMGLNHPDEAIGKSDFDFFEKDHAQWAFEDEQKLMESRIPLINKLEKIWAPEGYRYVSSTKIPLLGKNGEILGLFGISRNYTEQKMTELQLEKEKDLLQTLMDNIPDSIYFKDNESKFTRVNRALANILGIYNPAECIGKTDFDFFPEAQAKNLFSDERAILETGIPLINKIESITNKDKSTMWLSFTKIPLKNEDGEVTGLVGISRDVSAQELAKKSLEYAKEKAEEANKAKSVFLANMSHDIRTPMNGVIGMADILKRTNLTKEQQDYLDIIVKSGTNLLSIINDILDFSKIESGKMELEVMPINIRNIVEDVGDVLVVRANDKGINLITYVDTNMPGLVIGDEVRLRQILVNLLNNAVKFTSDGEVFISSEVSKIEGKNCEVLFKVNDTGIGIAKEVQPKLFQSFTQADASTTRKFGGTGLGLAICKKLVEQMGGKIGLKSDVGKGSLFWFSLNFEISEQVSKVVIQERETFKDLNFLIIDDNKTNRMIFRKYFEIWGCNSDEVVNGKMAIDMMQEEAKNGKIYDLALVDYQMEKMDGLEFAKKMKSIPEINKTKLVLLSSVSNIIPKNKEKEAGFEAYLNKPIKLKQLFETISKATGKAVEKEDIQKSKPGNIFKKDGLTVLIVEDNEINLKVAELSVKTVTSNIDFAKDGKVAAEKVMRKKYDVILMDIQMPVMNGYEATIKIREYEQQQGVKNPTKIIAMTANAMKEDKQHCLQVGMDAYMSKPFKSGDFVNTLKELNI